MESEIKLLKTMLIAVLVVQVVATYFVIEMRVELQKSDLGQYARMVKDYQDQLRTWQKDTEAWKRNMEAWEKRNQR